MLYTLSDALASKQIQRAVGNCNTTELTERINNAQELLLTHEDNKNTMRRVRIQAQNNFVTLPRQFESIKAYTLGHEPGLVMSTHFEYLEGGPGRIDAYAQTDMKTLVDIGSYYPTYADIQQETPLQVFAVSTHEDDTSQTLFLRGITTDNLEILTDGSLGLEISIIQFVGGVDGVLNQSLFEASLSAQAFKRIDFVQKSVTKGYVTLYAYNPDYTEGDDGEPMLYRLGKYHPDELQPGFRRYKIAAKCNNGCCCDYINALVKLAYVPSKHDTDILMIQSIPAITYGIKAVKHFEADEMDLGISQQGLALNILSKQLSDGSGHANEITVDSSFGLGEVVAPT